MQSGWDDADAVSATVRRAFGDNIFGLERELQKTKDKLFQKPSEVRGLYLCGTDEDVRQKLAQLHGGACSVFF